MSRRAECGGGRSNRYEVPLGLTPHQLATSPLPPGAGWEDVIQDANLSVEDINSLATLESICHHLEKSFDMVARYLPLLGLRPIDYGRHGVPLLAPRRSGRGLVRSQGQLLFTILRWE